MRVRSSSTTSTRTGAPLGWRRGAVVTGFNLTAEPEPQPERLCENPVNGPGISAFALISTGGAGA
ncbi:hypothetical protein Kisp01_06020 [Kineosporia sp. NBRC 101677]|nr:hypothetical protein Kisp01_06020 [Kineosporia sp. NBRC 101677]